MCASIVTARQFFGDLTDHSQQKRRWYHTIGIYCCIGLVAHIRFIWLKVTNNLYIDGEFIFKSNDLTRKYKNNATYCQWSKQFVLRMRGFEMKIIETVSLFILLIYVSGIISTLPYSVTILCVVIKYILFFSLALFFITLNNNDIITTFDIYSFLTFILGCIIGQNNIFFIGSYMGYLFGTGREYYRYYGSILLLMYFTPHILIVIGLAIDRLFHVIRNANNRWILQRRHIIARIVYSLALGILSFVFILAGVIGVYFGVFEARSLLQLNINLYDAVIYDLKTKHNIFNHNQYQTLFYFVNKLCYFLLNKKHNVGNYNCIRNRNSSDDDDDNDDADDDTVITHNDWNIQEKKNPDYNSTMIQKIGCIKMEILQFSKTVIKEWNKRAIENDIINMDASIKVVDIKNIQLIPLDQHETFKRLQQVEKDNLLSNTDDMQECFGDRAMHALKSFWKGVLLLIKQHRGNLWFLIDSDLRSIEFVHIKINKKILCILIIISKINSFLFPFYIGYFEMIKMSHISMIFKIEFIIIVLFYLSIIYYNCRYLVPLYSRLSFILNTKENDSDYLVNVFGLLSKMIPEKRQYRNDDDNRYRSLADEIIRSIECRLHALKIRPYQAQVVLETFGSDIGSIVLLYLPVYEQQEYLNRYLVK